MPRCRECRRVLPTCEVRRLPAGDYRCKDWTAGSLCWTTAKHEAELDGLIEEEQQAFAEIDAEVK